MAQSPLHALAKLTLILVMAAGSVGLWIGVPVGWLWIGSLLQSDTQATGFTPYIVVMIGIVVTAVLVMRALSALNKLYGRLEGKSAPVRVRLPWHRSMRGEDDSKAPTTVLDVVMVISVSSALFIFTIWFLFFAGSPLPN